MFLPDHTFLLSGFLKQCDTILFQQQPFLSSAEFMLTLRFTFETLLPALFNLQGEKRRPATTAADRDITRLPSPHLLFTVFLSIATNPSQWSHKKQIGAFREIACALKINNSWASSGRKSTEAKRTLEIKSATSLNWNDSTGSGSLIIFRESRRQ